jgi:alcohol dehydrogenase
MDALVVENGQLRMARRDIPSLQPGQSLIRIRKAGICNTDLELVGGYKNFNGILGHEFVGEVVAGDAAWIGRRVVGEINVADGTCDMCQQGIPSQCRNRTTVGINRHDGGFAEYLALATRNLHAVPHNVSDEQAVFVEPLAAAFQILEAVHVSPRHRVVVIGAGKLGLLCAQVLLLTGADVSAIARRDKIRVLLTDLGIRSVNSPDDLPAHHADLVVDCTGSVDGISAALDLVKPRGTIALKSTYHGLPSVNLTRVAVDEIRIVGSRCGPFEAALRALDVGSITTAPLIEARFALRDGIAAMQYAAQPGVLKVLLEVQ